MMQALTAFLLLAPVLFGQAPVKVDLLDQTRQLEALIAAGEWEKASELSRSLKAAAMDARNHSLSASGSELADSILKWMPVDTETFVVAQQPFALTSESPNEIPTGLQAAQSYVLGLLDAAEKETLGKALQGRTVALAVLAARRFEEHPPDQRGAIPLGLIAYQGCAVYSFAGPLPDSMIARPPDDSAMGIRAWTSKGSQSDLEDADTYFVSLLEPQLMAVCNNREFLQEMITRRSAPQQSRALAADLPEWKQVDRTAPLWGISHYGPNSPLAAVLPDNPEAIGIAVEFGLPSPPTRARMISKSDPWKGLTTSPDFQGAAKSQKVADDV